MVKKSKSKHFTLEEAARCAKSIGLDKDVSSGQVPSKLIVQMPLEARPKCSTPANPAASRWAFTVPMLRSTQKKLLDVLAVHSDEYGVSWCRQKTLAFETGCSDRTVRTVLNLFEFRGLIRRVGRLGQHGAQLTDVVILVGWPDRKLIPTTGHRILKLAIQESFETRRQWSQLQPHPRQQLPRGVAARSDQNISIINNTTTEQIDEVLTVCFEALGSWATTENRQHLSDDTRTLQDWLDRGIDLHRHVVPVLTKKATSQAKIPVLRTWRYFEVPIGKAVNRKGLRASVVRAKGEVVQAGAMSSEEAPRAMGVAYAEVMRTGMAMSDLQEQQACSDDGVEQIQFNEALAAVIAGQKRRSGKVEA